MVVEHTACAADIGAVCEYGGDALTRNTVLADCGSAVDDPTPRWHVGAFYPVAANGAQCPASWTAARTATIACARPAALACDYDEGRCACVCGGPGTATWKCRARDEVYDDRHARCPSTRPRIGDACSPAMRICYYTASGCDPTPQLGPNIECNARGYWDEAYSIDRGAGGSGGCPSSC